MSGTIGGRAITSCVERPERVVGAAEPGVRGPKHEWLSFGATGRRFRKSWLDASTVLEPWRRPESAIAKRQRDLGSDKAPPRVWSTSASTSWAEGGTKTRTGLGSTSCRTMRRFERVTSKPGNPANRAPQEIRRAVRRPVVLPNSTRRIARLSGAYEGVREKRSPAVRGRCHGAERGRAIFQVTTRFETARARFPAIIRRRTVADLAAAAEVLPGGERKPGTPTPQARRARTTSRVK